MDQKTDNILTYVLYFSLTLILLFVLIQNINNPWMILLLSGLIIASVTVRNAVIYPSDKYRNLGKLTLIFDMIIAFLITLLDQSTSSGIYFYILVVDCSIAYSTSFTGVITILSYLVFNLSQYINLSYTGFGNLIPHLGISTLSFFTVFAIMYAIKHEIRQRNQLSQTMYELKVKSKQLENTYLKLKETSEELEDLTIVKERNRIAREIHDTVGHTLTTVLLEMEAGERLIPIDPYTATEKIKLAKAQVRKGLQDIRESVTTLQAGRELMEFIPSLKLLIEETTKHGDIYINYDIKELPRLSPLQEKMIYRALQEGLTNGIKHGKSTAFVFQLDYNESNETLHFMLQDNGKGTENYVKGFGLNAMEERIKELGGILSILTEPEEGFQLNILIPVEREETDETNSITNRR